ncbi:hypothetical protein SCHIN_v1c06710 [Spiroplasma chinense]|uniref:Uncharacterized protein n=1 Tax=Spiroplasma chinense TaxID=216932 RepID=A0A5B9Y3Y1_9MOLU|nr:hypothetical protein [Spiroplasma chinense]QEH61868.1 hypothetical protein SCHIN_v1c06710 [Spiroplasma chinense]
MSNKKIFEMDENLRLRTDRIYVNQTIFNCQHPQLAFDRRDDHIKCTTTGCWREFWLRTDAEYYTFKDRMIDKFDFEKAEKEFKRQIRLAKAKAKKEKEISDKAKGLL